MSGIKRVIVDYKKLTPRVLKLLVEKYPDGYGDRDIINFKMKGKTIEAVEVATSDTKYLVMISSKLQRTMANFDEADATIRGVDAMGKNPDGGFVSLEEE
ncbi:hypothetical protein [Flagellimonas myxillae]|uniref:hypothetical protein n=1 Tax=Flagellimonas myxillae TaxID=2942214 RepID=UPI00201EEE96|nr:hypothetical protein [Muricauda myxillae]MCL6266983.1 hypothetical protein [Muricauda myxillae]